ncbi:hypothetical protein OAT34_02965 [Candidatus Pelagibacter sp.]|nr:hypothetical protein [Candidatus Pelagibacter sp.]
MEIKNFFKSSSRSIKSRKNIVSKIQKNVPIKNYYNFGFDYFDNTNLSFGYGGYKYDGRQKKNVQKIINFFKLSKTDKIAEFGCAKGFVLVEFLKKKFKVIGFEKSKYAVKNCHPLLKKKIININKVSEINKYKFDFLICKDVIPSLTEKQIEYLINTTIKKSKYPPYFIIQTFRNKKNIKYYKEWDKTHVTIKDKKEWIKFLKKFNKKIYYSFNYLF